MSNFLTNLVERFNQPSAVVQARPVSLFEPQTRLDFPAWSAAGWQNPANLEALEQPSDPQAHAAPPDSQAQAATSARTVQPRLGDKPHPRPLSAEQQRPATAPTSKPPAQLGYLVVQPRFQVDQPFLETSDSEIIPPFQAKRPRLEPERGADLEEGTPPRERQAHIRPKEIHPKPGPKTILQPALREAEVSPKPIHSNSQMAAESESPSAEPVIHVTIGRVEVLAVPPTEAPKPQKNSRPNPVMSLDEYLKNRDQERQP